MPIAFLCPCGKSLQVKDQLAGKVVRCPVCTQQVIVPSIPFFPAIGLRAEW